jgi:hypothetical protein
MTDNITDNITLRRAAEQARSALSGWANHGLWAWPESALQTCKQNTEEALAALDAALAEPEQKPEPVAWMVTTTDERHFIFRMVKPVVSEGETLTPLYTHPPAAPPEPPAKPEPATREQVAEAYKASESDGGEVIYCEAWRDAERFHGIRKEDGK